MKKYFEKFITLLIFFGYSLASHSNIVDFTYSAELTLVDSPLNSSYTVGDIVTGSFSIDTSALDTNSNSGAGSYINTLTQFTLNLSGDIGNLDLSTTRSSFSSVLSSPLTGDFSTSGKLTDTPGMPGSGPVSIWFGFNFSSPLFDPNDLSVIAQLIPTSVLSPIPSTGVIDWDTVSGVPSTDFRFTSISVVPIPAAIWLLTPALIGLLRINRNLKI